MTKEEIKSRLDQGESPYTLIAKICYDFSNRKCQNCKFSIEHERYQVLICDLGVSNCKDTFKTVDYDFSCNEWRLK